MPSDSSAPLLQAPLSLASPRRAEQFLVALSSSPPDWLVRSILGSECINRPALHAAVAAALQFPAYYGHNWDAMDECITDLEWLPATRYLIHIDGIEDLLPNESDGFTQFLGVLLDAHRSWRHPEARGQAVPFHVLFSGSQAGLARVRAAVPEEHRAEA